MSCVNYFSFFLVISCLLYQVCQCAKSLCYVGESPQANESCSKRKEILNLSIDKFKVPGRQTNILRDAYLTIIPSQNHDGIKPKRCKKSNRRKINTGSAKSLVEFSCPYKYTNNYFHRIFDCFIGLIDVYTAANESIHSDASNTVLLIPEDYSNTVLELFDLVTPDRVQYNFKITKKSDCIIASEKAVITHASSTVLWPDYFIFPRLPQSHPFYLNMVANTQKFLNIIQFYKDRTFFGKRAPSVLYIKRQGTRQLTNIESLWRRILKNFPHMRGEIYWGTENVQETIKKFYEADIVIGFHGAGLVNVMFCKSNVLVVEISLLMHDVPDDGKSQLELKHLWRSNIVIGMLHGQLHWISFAMQVDDKIRNLNDKKCERIKSLTLNEKEIYSLSNFIKHNFEYTSTGDLVNKNMSYTWDIISQDHRSNYSHAAIPGQYHSSKLNISLSDNIDDDDDDDNDDDNDDYPYTNSSELKISTNGSSALFTNASIILKNITTTIASTSTSSTTSTNSSSNQSE